MVTLSFRASTVRSGLGKAARTQISRPIDLRGSSQTSSVQLPVHSKLMAAVSSPAPWIVRYARCMASVTVEVVEGKVRYNGRTLEWVPDVVDAIVRHFAPRRVILFRSVARGDEGPDSAIDLLVVLADLRAEEKLRLLGDLIRVGSIAPPVDAIPTDEAELAEHGHLPGMLRTALREGRVVYEQP
jgi:hypothetical protein